MNKLLTIFLIAVMALSAGCNLGGASTTQSADQDMDTPEAFHLYLYGVETLGQDGKPVVVNIVLPGQIITQTGLSVDSGMFSAQDPPDPTGLATLFAALGNAMKSDPADPPPTTQPAPVEAADLPVR